MHEERSGYGGFVKLNGFASKVGEFPMATLRNFNGLTSWKNAEKSLQSVNFTMPPPSLTQLV